MKVASWTVISGSWRHSSADLRSDVRATVREILQQGGGICAGGALGVDYEATDEALKHDPQVRRIRVILPTSLKTYERHYLQRASEGVISFAEANSLIAQLRAIKAANPLA